MFHDESRTTSERLAELFLLLVHSLAPPAHIHNEHHINTMTSYGCTAATSRHRVSRHASTGIEYIKELQRRRGVIAEASRHRVSRHASTGIEYIKKLQRRRGVIAEASRLRGSRRVCASQEPPARLRDYRHACVHLFDIWKPQWRYTSKQRAVSISRGKTMPYVNSAR